MKKAIIVILMFFFVLTACSSPGEDPEATVVVPSQTSVVIPTTTPTERPPVVFTVCTTSLPDESLFPYTGLHSEAKQRILSLLYPPAFAPGQADLQPMSLESVPTQAGGDLRLEPVSIRRGQQVVDVNGQLVTAVEGVQVRPSGCREHGCAITWDGIIALEMDQMVVDFTLKEGLTWSDGTTVTAGDSVFSYRLATAPENPNYGFAEDHTEDYRAVDERTITWLGYPGFATPDLARFFWLPLPAHQFDPGVDFDQVAAAQLWLSSPTSYGPFIVTSRAVDEIRLARNPHQSAGFPIYAEIDQVVLREVNGGALAGWQALQDGACDMLDASFMLADQPGLLSEIESAGRYQVRVTADGSWTQLVFGIQPAEYDTLTNSLFALRPDFFGDVRTRQGFAACLDRQAMQDLINPGLSIAWPSFLSPEESQLAAGIGIVQDPQAGMALLNEAGWVDHDLDPATARIAQGVMSVFNGTSLSMDLLVGPLALHQALAVTIQDSLQACGVQVNLQTLPLNELYAPGPQGALFGRRFDLALIAWQPLPGPDCGLYVDWAIPAPANSWIGTNIAGFSDAGYDQACAAAGLATPDEFATLLAQAELAFMDLLPAVPLFAPARIEVVAEGWLFQ